VWTAMVEARESALSLDGERRVAERDVGEARREFERLDREMAEALAARTQVDDLKPEMARVEPLRAELDGLEREARTVGRRRSIAGQVSELDVQHQRFVERLARVEEATVLLDGAAGALVAARASLADAEAAEDRARTGWVRDRQDAETKRQSLRDQYVDLQKHRQSVVQAGEGGECPVCKRPLGAVYEEVLDTLARQIEEIEVRGKYFRQRVEQLENAPPDVADADAAVREATARVEQAVQEVARCEDRARERQEIETELARIRARREALERELAELPDAYDAARHDAVREELRRLEPTVRLVTELNVRAARAEQLVAEAEAAERTLSEREARVRALEAALTAVGFSEEAYATTRRRYDEAERAVRVAALEEAGVQGDVRAAAAALADVDRRLEEREGQARRVTELRLETRLHDELDRALHDLRSELNAAMRPELADRASEFLSSLTDGRYQELELDENYELLVVEDGRAQPVLSGGEEDVTHLVLRLAISQMVAERAGQPLSLLVLDEIFGSLDEHRRHNVVQLLRALADRFPQVILITHIESVRDGVDRVVRVARDEQRGTAVVTEDREGGDDVAA
jgi:exonuclease SbcC